MKRIYYLNFLFLIALLSGWNWVAQAQTSYSSSGAYVYTVPSCMAVKVDMAGGQGGSGDCEPGGYGGRVVCTLAVSPGQLLYTYVGGAGTNYNFGYSAGGYNGGGQGYYYGGGGGGATDVRLAAGAVGTYTTTNRIIVAGGGGGSGYYYCNTTDIGGVGGYPAGANGLWGGTSSYSTAYSGAGGTQTNGGAAPTSGGGATAGAIGTGGNAATTLYGGGGGGGYYGGSGAYYQGGGGGSSYTATTGITGVTFTNGFETGSGYCTFTPIPPTLTCTPTSLNFGAVLVGTSATPPLFASLNGSFMFTTTPLTVNLTGSGFLMSVDGVTWGTGPATLTLPGSSFTGLNIYVKFNPTAVTSYTGTIAITGGGLPSAFNIPLSGSGANPCTGAPSVGSAVISPAAGGPYTPFSLSLSGAAPSVGGLTYQWQVAPASSGPWTNIGGAILPTYSFTGTGATAWYRCQETCGATGATTVSTPGLLTLSSLPASSCTPTSGGADLFITVATAAFPFIVVNNSGSSMVDGVPMSSSSVYYRDNTGPLVCYESASSTVNTTIGGANTTQAMSAQMWVDFNSDGIFQTSESVGGVASIAAASVAHPVLTIPSGVTPGAYRLRVVVDLASYLQYPNLAPCPTTSYSEAETRDYTMVIVAPQCSGPQVAGITAATPLSGCVTPYLPTFFAVGTSTNSGVTYQWQSATSAGGPFANIGGATNLTYASSATDITTSGVYYYHITATCGASVTTSALVSVSLNSLPSPITGSNNLCTGVASTLISTPSGGSWSSNNVLVATAASATGAVTGVVAGTDTIVYTLPTGCTAMYPVTINTQPLPISGPTAICATTAASYSDVTPGGSWGSSTPSVLNVNPFSGAATTNLPGTVNVCYTSIVGCVTCTNVTVNAQPTQYVVSPGTGSYCAGSASTTAVQLGGSQTGVSYQLLLSGSPVGPALAGTGVPLNFGIQTTPGTYTVVASNPTTSCTRNMISQTIITQNPLPDLHTVSVTGGGTYCSGSYSTAPHIVTIDGSQTGVTYTLYYDGAPTTTTRPGVTGSNLDFGPATLAGTYTVKASMNATGCSQFMLGSGSVAINPLPTDQPLATIPSSSAYCTGGAGVDIKLGYSTTGIQYSMYLGAPVSGTPISTLAGTGGILDFGYQLASGTYYVVATNVTTGCTFNLTTTPTVSVSAPPTAYPFTTDALATSGSYCAGGAGVNLVLQGTDPGASYQLNMGTTPVGGPISGTGLSVTIPGVTAAGTYNVVGTSVGGCNANMAGLVSVIINPVPAVETVTGGGNYCVGGTGRNIGLNPSVSGISYQLISSTTGLPISTLAGTGGSLNYGLFTATGGYFVAATDLTTGCKDTMAGVATIATNPLPAAANVTVTSGGMYCAGSTGPVVGLDASATGITYQLYRGTPGVAVGAPVSGTGSTINFGSQTVAGTYTVIANNVSTGCVGSMAGSANVIINALPTGYAVTGGGNFCVGDTGVHVGLNGSDAGISYQLYDGLSTVGLPMAGSGSLLDFGLQTLGGTYAIKATNIANGCVKYMTGGVPVNVNSLPASFTVTGGGVYCSGGTGVHIGISGSEAGIRYQLENSGVAVGTPITGSGASVDFGLFTSSGTYTAVALNPTTGCGSNMLSGVHVATAPLPTVYTVSGGGGYCAGGAGSPVNLSGSDISVNYQLYVGTSSVGSAVAGTGAGVSFGSLTGAGNYTVVATNSVTGCANDMAASATISVYALPRQFPVTGGGAYCMGAPGLHVFLSGTSIADNYQLYSGGIAIGSMVTGSGSAVDFGILTNAGGYSVVATDPVTGCTNNMADSVTITVNAVPVVHNVTGGGNYCTGGTGADVGLDSSNTGINYQLYHSGSLVGAAVPGTGLNLDFGMHAGSGSYTVVATNATTGCTSNMAGMANVTPLALPGAYTVTGGGNYCATGFGVAVGLANSDVSVNYQLWHGTSPVGVPVMGTGAAISFGLQTISGGYTVSATTAGATACSNNMTGSATVGVLPVVLPNVNITPSIPGIVCVGQNVRYTASPINGGTAPTYQWMVNGINVGIGTTYSYIPNNGDVVTAMITSNAICAIPDTGSHSMTVTVSPSEMPSASVTINPGNQVCTGATASFTAHPLYGGTAPSLNWVVNSSIVSTGTSYAYVPNNGDIVTFMLGSNFPCRLADTVFSSPVTMQVQPAVLPIVTVSSNPAADMVAVGQTVTFNANVVNGGSAPTYQWLINSHPVSGATNSSYTTSNLNNNDSVTCQVEGNCGLVGFNSVEVKTHVVGVGVAQVSGGTANLSLAPNPNKGDFILKGNLTAANDQEMTIEVTDMLGQVVYSTKSVAVNGVVNEHIQVNNLANGNYLVNVRTAAEQVVFHFVVEK